MFWLLRLGWVAGWLSRFLQATPSGKAVWVLTQFFSISPLFKAVYGSVCASRSEVCCFAAPSPYIAAKIGNLSIVKKILKAKHASD
jgi:hypothetical protein